MAQGSEEATPPFPWPKAIARYVAGAALYVLFPLVAPLNLANESTIPLLGLGLGLAVGLAARFPTRLVLPVALGGGTAVAVGSLMEDDVVVALAVILGLGVTAEIWVVTYLLRRTGGTRLRTTLDVLALVVVAVLCALLVALLAALVVTAFGLEMDMFWHEVRSWATDDVFGLVCVAPAIMLFRAPRSWEWTRAVEYGVAAGLSFASTVIIFFVVDPANPGLLGWPYLVVLGPAWIAVRLGVAAVAPVTAVVFWIAAVATAQGVGPFATASADAPDRLVAVELFAIVLTGGLLALGVLRDDRLRQLVRANESSRLLREVIDGSDAAVFAKEYESAEAEGKYVLVNEAWGRITGFSAAQTIGRTDREIFGRRMSRSFLEHDHLVLAYDRPLSMEERIDPPEQEVRIFNSAKFPLRGADGRAWGIGGIATDITEAVQSREREDRQADLLRAVFALSPTPAMRMALVGEHSLQVLDANAAMFVLLGLPVDDLEACDLMARVHPDDLAAAWDIITFSLTSTGSHGVLPARQREVRLHTADGRMVWVVMSAAAVIASTGQHEVEIVAQFEDFTARREAETALSDQAMRDSVTGLPNRRAFNDRLASALLRLRRTPGVVTVLFCDLDRFKDVNDTYGHQVGDQLLVEVADRLRAALPPDDTVARLGGDEFVVLTEAVADASDAVLLGLRLQDRLGAPWVHEGQTFRPEMSVGVAMTEDPDVSGDEILRRADLAMYEAKDRGRNRIEVYQRSVDDEIQRAVAIQHDLRKAIDASGLVLHYQPVVRLSDEQVVGAEALVRMRGADGVLLLPGAFVPQAEATGLVVPMGAWVMRKAMADLRKWRERGFEYIVSVNVSQWQHREDGFASFVLDQAEFAGINPAWLVVEVTETALIHDPARSSRELSVLSRAGVGIALDDFGTGYSSLSWLTQLPVTTVKIDQSFTAELGIDERKGAIVRALIEVSHDLGLKVVAEGVETRAQLERLVELGCDQGQGYLWGVPVAVDEAPWL